ncbi:MFS transporter [Nigerium massiliense]|uniref:MFS transporter n=1 Tax=Nigerium massiliense TaxID=1522317 RepID=UPI00058EF63A|nr:MFS transporter [Nigerium massiliense]
MRSSRGPGGFAWFAVAAVVLLALNLRPGATSVGPVLAEVSRDLGMGPTMAGVLTALPGLCFGVVGAVAVWVAARLSLSGALAVGTVAAAAGLLARSFSPDPWSFLVFSVLAFAGMALGNVLLPSFIKRHFPVRTVLVTALYTCGLSAGATLASLTAAPLSHALPGGWRASLGAWGVASAVALALWIPLGLRERRQRRAGAALRPPGSLWGIAHSPKAVALALFFGTQSMQAYVQFGWIAQIFRDAGVSQALAGVLASIIAACGMPEGLLMPGVLARMRDPRWLGPITGVLLLAGYLGILLAPLAAPVLWALLLGLSGAAFPTAIALITARSRDPHVTAQLSGFTQSVGYLLAAVGPFAIGSLHAVTGGWTVPLIVLAASSVVMAASGWISAAPGFVDDELPAAD